MNTSTSKPGNQSKSKKSKKGGRKPVVSQSIPAVIKEKPSKFAWILGKRYDLSKGLLDFFY
jgi:hypothetical protein